MISYDRSSLSCLFFLLAQFLLLFSMPQIDQSDSREFDVEPIPKEILNKVSMHQNKTKAEKEVSSMVNVESASFFSNLTKKALLLFLINASRRSKWTER